MASQLDILCELFTKKIPVLFPPTPFNPRKSKQIWLFFPVMIGALSIKLYTAKSREFECQFFEILP